MSLVYFSFFFLPLPSMCLLYHHLSFLTSSLPLFLLLPASPSWDIFCLACLLALTYELQTIPIMLGCASALQPFLCACVCSEQTYHVHITWRWFDDVTGVAVFPMTSSQFHGRRTRSQQRITYRKHNKEDDGAGWAIKPVWMAGKHNLCMDNRQNRRTTTGMSWITEKAYLCWHGAASPRRGSEQRFRCIYKRGYCGQPWLGMRRM